MKKTTLKTSSPHSQDDAEFLAMLESEFGSGHVHKQPNQEEMVVAEAVFPLRAMLREALKESRMSMGDLARMMSVSTPVISRFFASEGDLKVSTAALIAHYLGKSYQSLLVNKAVAQIDSNNFPATTVRVLPTAQNNPGRSASPKLGVWYSGDSDSQSIKKALIDA